MSRHKLHFFIGSYTEMLAEDFGDSGNGIYTVEMDLESGKIELLQMCFVTNPAYLVRNGKVLYAVKEVELHKIQK